MIEKLRRKFIVVAMCSTLAVLTVIIGTLNIVSYRSMADRTDEILELLAANNGRFPDNIFEKKEIPPDRGHFEISEGIFPQGQNADGVFFHNKFFMREKGRNFTRETPYETRFFSVKFNQNGQVGVVDTGKVASVETQEAIVYAETAWKKFQKNSTTKGFLNDYRYLVTENGSGFLLIFVDAAREMQSVRSVLTVSLLVSAGGLLAVFLLVVIFSRIVFRPVENSYRKQRQFITDASHELKTPLTIISANVDVLEMESEKTEWSESIQRQVQRMSGLVEQMVTLSRMEEETAVAKEQFSLSDAVRETAELFLPVAERSQKSLDLDICEGISCVGDEKLLRQLICLLLDNAVKYAAVGARIPDAERMAAGAKTPSAARTPDAERTPVGATSSAAKVQDAERTPVGATPSAERIPDADGQPEIRLSLKKKGKKAEICLWNLADHLEQGNQDVLFERFYRPDSSRNSAKGGSGIGLSIARSIVEIHKGKITAVSKDGKSIEFKAVIPIL